MNPMTAIMLGWNPERAIPGPWRAGYAAAVREVAGRGLSVQPWTASGDMHADVWLVLQGSRLRGLAGHGVVAGRDGRHLLVVFDSLLPLGDHIPFDVLADVLPGAAEDSDRLADILLGPDAQARVRALWAELGPGHGPEPVLPAAGAYPAEAVAHVPVNRYERDPEARRACIAHRGSSCAVCGFSFEVAYGEIGKDFVDVHHAVPPGTLGTDYELDPLTDLVPLCANCHAMAHLGVGTPRTEMELRQAMAGAGFLAGSVVTPEELAAQRAAREILGPGQLPRTANAAGSPPSRASGGATGGLPTS
jgi:5-methylcytosine-specific restriction enzyme A